MDYKIIINKRALKEIKEAINYYKSKSYLAPINFTLNLEKTYSSLTKYPYYRIRYKNVRSIKVKNSNILFFTFCMKKQV